MEIHVTRARAFNGMVVLSGLTRPTMSGNQRRVEYVVRGDAVALWRYFPATGEGVTVVMKGDVERLYLKATDEVDADQLDDVLWQACVGLSSSPLRYVEDEQ